MSAGRPKRKQMRKVDDARFDAQREQWRRDGITADSTVDAANLTVRAHNALLNSALVDHGTPIRALSRLRLSAVSRWRNCGAVSMAEVSALLEFCGLAWTTDDADAAVAAMLSALFVEAERAPITADRLREIAWAQGVRL